MIQEEEHTEDNGPKEDGNRGKTYLTNSINVYRGSLEEKVSLHDEESVQN